MVPSEAANHAIRGPCELDLDPRSLARQVGGVRVLGHDAIDPAAGELKPLTRLVCDFGRRRHEQWSVSSTEEFYQHRPPDDERLSREVVVIESEEIEGDKGCWRLPGEMVDATLGGMETLQQRVEIGTLSIEDNYLAVDCETSSDRLKCFHEFGEVTGQRPLMAAPHVDILARGED
jgi:hypothetical protein